MPPPGKKRGALYVALAVVAVVITLAHVPTLTRLYLGHDDGDGACFGFFCIFASSNPFSALEDAVGDGGHDLSSSSSSVSVSASAPSMVGGGGGGGEGGGEKDDAFSPVGLALAGVRLV
jgi:hypothetical protein